MQLFLISCNFIKIKGAKLSQLYKVNHLNKKKTVRIFQIWLALELEFNLTIKLQKHAESINQQLVLNLGCEFVKYI